jgi:hypothetical protein
MGQEQRETYGEKGILWKSVGPVAA